LRSQKPETDPGALMSDANARAVFGISKMTATRWSADERIGWPATVATIRGRNFVRAAAVYALRDRLIEATERGESQTVTPPRPQRKSGAIARDAKPRMGGFVSG
jgi:hypothetical protein